MFFPWRTEAFLNLINDFFVRFLFINLCLLPYASFYLK